MSLQAARELAEALRESEWADYGPVPSLSWRGEGALYRLVRSDPVTARDFTSPSARGVPPLSAATAFVLHTGISMFDEQDLARDRARPPTYLAEVRLTEGHGFYLAKTFGRGHYTVWGEVLVSLAEVVERIEP